MEQNYYIGVDVSKNKLDFVLRNAVKVLDHRVIKNTMDAIKTLLSEWQNEYGISSEHLLISCESTGEYDRNVRNLAENYKVWVVNPYTLKHSMGLRRAKNDKVDAEMIAEHAYRFSDRAVLHVIDCENVEDLRLMNNARTKLVEMRKALKMQISECSEPKAKKSLEEILNPLIEDIDKKIKEIEEKEQEIVNSDKDMSNQFKIVTSVPGVGKVTGWLLLIVTKKFNKFQNAKQLACFSGVVPFEHSSGKSIKKNPKISKMANKELKCILSLCVRSVLQGKNEFRTYYDRKIKEGKAILSVLNAMKNKLLLRIFACVRDNRFYEENYQIVK
jgi:transposase